MMHEQILDLAKLLQGRRVVALTGAGCSTASGIPDYRGPLTKHKARNPVQYRAFLGDQAQQERYWARSMVGWRRMAQAQPNATHHALAQLERMGLLAGIITQNVDRLHHRAGSRRVVELHGALAEVRCLSCGLLEDRDALQQRLLQANPQWQAWTAAVAPDGDAELPQSQHASFQLVGCISCAGVLKPDVVFFGEHVPPHVLSVAWRLCDEAEVLLVLGTSLAVFSGFRFVRRANQVGTPVVIINQGTSRGDALATLCIDARLETVLPAVTALLQRCAPLRAASGKNWQGFQEDTVSKP